MKSKKCIVCSINKGKRGCKINDNLLICPVCCTKIRSSACEGCQYFIQAQKYSRTSTSKKNSDPFIMMTDPEVNERVNQALDIAERGNIRQAELIIISQFIQNPQNDMVQYGMGVICLMKKDYDEAIPFFSRALEINPYFVEAWFNKGHLHQDRLEIAQAIEAYRKVIELGDPTENYVVYAKSFINTMEKSIRKTNNLNLDEYLLLAEGFNAAFKAMGKRDYEKALTGFQKVIKKDPRHVQSWGNMGLCYAFLGKKQDALQALDNALEIDSNYEPAIDNRKIIASLADGEKLILDRFESVDYYKDIVNKKR